MWRTHWANGFDGRVRIVAKSPLPSFSATYPWGTTGVPSFFVQSECGIKVRSDMGAYAGAARRRFHLATVLLRPPSGHRPGRHQARHAHILQNRPPLDATMKRVDAPSAWSSTSDLDKKESDGRDPPQGVAPHVHRGVVGAPELCR